MRVRLDGGGRQTAKDRAVFHSSVPWLTLETIFTDLGTKCSKYDGRETTAVRVRLDGGGRQTAKDRKVEVERRRHVVVLRPVYNTSQ